MKWEYKVVQIDDSSNFENSSKLQNEFNKYGSEGWEIVSMLTQEPKGSGWVSSTTTNYLLLKRALN